MVCLSGYYKSDLQALPDEGCIWIYICKRLGE